MQLDPMTLLTFLGMMAVTYGARIGGYWLMTRFPPRGAAKAALEATPMAVLTAVIAPTALATGWPETLAAAVTLLLALRLPLLVALAGGLGAVVVLRMLLA